MDQSIKKFMQVGTILHVTYPELGSGEGPVLERLSGLIADEYFDAVEFTEIKDPGVRAAAAKLVEEAHMVSSFSTQGMTMGRGVSLCSAEEAVRQEAVGIVKHGIDLAREMGCLDVQFMSGTPGDAPKEKAYGQLIRSTKELCAYADEIGIPLVCEVFDYDVDKNALIGPAPLAARYAEEICAEYPSFGLQADLSHVPLLHETIEENILPVAKYIKHAHIGNGVAVPGMEAYGDMHPRFGFPGGGNDVPQVVEFLRMLQQIGYLDGKHRPLLSFEVKPRPDESPEAVLANAKRTLSLAWALL